MRIIGDGGHARAVRCLFPSTEPDGYWICAVGDNASRKREVEAHPDYNWFNRGTVILQGAVVCDANNDIGRHVIINCGAIVTHDCVIEDYAHIAPGAILCGNVHVGEGALVGAGAVCVPGARIAPWSLVKAGSVAK